MTHQGQSPCGSLNSLPTDWARHSFIRYTIRWTKLYGYCDDDDLIAYTPRIPGRVDGAS